MVAISALARQFDLSRTALLYYERIGLLRASHRTASGYRDYNSQDVDRLRTICLYRNAGLSLKVIATILDGVGSHLSDILNKRLTELDHDIMVLRSQQELILGLLKHPRTLAETNIMNKATWVALLRASGYTQDDMNQWHIQFERHNPHQHQRFLEFLCIPEEEIVQIRSNCVADRV